MPRFRRLSVVLCASLAFLGATAQNLSFKVIAFYTAKNDAAHISYVHEANRWFAEMAKLHHFSYDSTNDWSRMTETPASVAVRCSCPVRAAPTPASRSAGTTYSASR